MRKLTGTVISLALLALFAAGPAQASATVAVAGYEAATLGFATPVVVAPSGGPITLVVADESGAKHNFVAADSFKSGSTWCGSFPSGKCPRFWTPLIGGSGAHTAAVQGLAGIPSGQYAFVCTLHSAMTGTLIVP